MSNKISIVTFNIRCVYDKDGTNSFIHRAGLIFDKIKKEKPDIIAFQEILEPHLNFLEKMMPEYIFVGQHRGNTYNGEGLFTAIKKSSFALMGLKSFWLSPTPFIPGTRFETQSKLPRICVSTELRHIESGKVLRIFNLHLDHISDEARKQGMKCVFDIVEQFNNELEMPMVILGDFNALPESEVIKMCNGYDTITEITPHIDVSFHDFGRNAQKIDYIYISNTLADSVTSVQAWEDECNGIFLSDHYPICANLEL